jgi:hypothetical protein
MIHDGEKKWIKKNYNKNFNQQITMDFLMTKFRLYFPKFQSRSLFVELIFFPPNMYNNFFCKWVAFHMDFIT